MRVSKLWLPLAALVAAAIGCDPSSSPTPDADGGAAGVAGAAGSAGSAGSAGAGAVSQNVRGTRYCEVLVGTLSGASIRFDVYNTHGLNDCPAEAWSKIDADQIKASLGADAVRLNGPRYWLMDSFVNSTLADPTVKALGGIEMRKAGTIEVPLAEAMQGGKPYTPRSVQRTTTWVFDPQKPVFELVDPTGRVFDMQSYSVQLEPQTEASLPDLGARLGLPPGWSYRSRTISEELRVTAVDGLATVVQDDLGNTYQLSQQ